MHFTPRDDSNLNGRQGPTINRRNLFAVTAAALAAGIAPRITMAADEYPSRPIRIVVGATPGGSIDYGARVVAAPLSEILKTPILIENKPGAAGLISTEYVIRAQPDGYTLLFGTPSPVIIAPQAMPKVRFNPLTDLIPINMVSKAPIAIAVNPNIGVKNLKELVALSKTRPIKMGLPLSGSLSHLVVEMVAKATGCVFLNVPYKGAAPALTDAMAGHVDATVGDVGVFQEMHKENKLRIVMITADKRLDALPDVATLSEDAQGLVITNWLGLFAPANVSSNIIEKVNAALMKVAASDEVKVAFQKVSAVAGSLQGPPQFKTFVASEYERYGQVVRERNIVIGE